MRIYAYLRASTPEQHVNRAEQQLTHFVAEHQRTISTLFYEHESGATLKRPQLFHLLHIAQAGDVLLVEQVDRISRLNAADWQKLRQLISEKHIHIVALDLPTSHMCLKQHHRDDFTERMFDAINSMMLDMLAAIARKDYEDRRRRQAQGIDAAKAKGKYKGRQMDVKKRDYIKFLLESGHSYREIVDKAQCSQGLIASVSMGLKREALHKESSH
mgnify:CR=1 FL=1|tara:strand:+ start:881 stop:1525 length:645 start_codon:yes stop_codon:yes gene_type:complete